MGRCESCGREEDDLDEVVRLYVTPEAWDQQGAVTEAAGTESWCYVCRTHYPHRVVGDPSGTAP